MEIAGRPLYAATAAEWRSWLEANHAAKQEVWLLFYKKHVAVPCVSLEEATEEAMCFGWVDSIQKRIDDEKHALRFTPRKKRSVWSESNKKRVAALIRQGRMTPAGLSVVEEAKRNGQWEKAAEREDVHRLAPDFRRALAANRAARSNFEKLPISYKKQFLSWIADARSDATRARRIKQATALLEQNRKKPGGA
jgi:uncharacterized protein YdeI (YjbR/CyaY-like superfamily)